MKKIYLAILIATSISLGSCTKDFVELEPKVNQLEGNFYKTENDAYLSLGAVYDALSVQLYGFAPSVADVRSDDTFTGGSDPGDMIQWQQAELGKMDPENSTAFNMWDRCYSGIYRANILLSKIDQIAWKNDDTKKRIIAETKFLRGYFYWDLARHFGWAPIITSVISDPDAVKSLPQATPAQLYSQVASDLLAALADLPVAVPAAEAGRVSKGAAQALIARIYMFYEGFVKNTLKVTTPWTDGTTVIDKAYAKAALESVIASKQYRLLPNYADVFSWTNQNNAEEVFSFQYNSASGAGDWGNVWAANGNTSCIWLSPRNPVGGNVSPGWSLSVPSFSLVAEFEENDPRLAATIFDANEQLTKYDAGYQNTGYFNNKFIALTSFISKKGDAYFNWGLNYPDIRYSDVLLMAAELNLSDDATKAVSYFNQVRTRSLGASAAKSSISIDDIYHERRVELGGEGHRYWDLLRRGLDYTEAKVNASFQNIPVRNNVTASEFTPRNFNVATYGMYPIPGSEIRLSGGNLKQYVPAYLNY